MKMNKLFGALLLMLATSVMVSCKGKKSDADIQADVASKISAMPGVIAETKDGVVTLSGTVEAEPDKATAETLTQSAEGVKSVVNNIAVTPAPVVTDTTAATVTPAPDAALATGVQDIMKDFPSASATVSGGTITVTGELSKDKWKKLKMSLDALKPKKVDASGLTVK